MPAFSRYNKQMTDTVVALVPLLGMAVFHYGTRVLILTAVSMLFAIIADGVFLLLHRERKLKHHDLSVIPIALTFVMFLPATAPYWLAAVGSAFAVAFVREPFGGHYNTLFHPATTAFAFLLICFNTLCTRYPSVMQSLPLDPVVTTVPLYTSPAYRLMLGGAESIDLLDVLLGNFSGPLGTTCILVMACCGLYLMVRKTTSFEIVLAAVATVSLCSYFLPRLLTVSPLTSVKLELSSGAFLFITLFIASVDNGEMQTRLGKITYGVLFGGGVMLFRYLSKIEMVSPFALIIMNALDHRCDDYGRNLVAALWWLLKKGKQLLLGLLCKAKKLIIFLWNGLFRLIQKFVDPSEGGKKP